MLSGRKASGAWGGSPIYTKLRLAPNQIIRFPNLPKVDRLWVGFDPPLIQLSDHFFRKVALLNQKRR
jgi:hypothetical protein